MANTKVVRKTIELLLDKAKTQLDFDMIKYTIDDYLNDDCHIEDMISKYNEKHRAWVAQKNLN